MFQRTLVLALAALLHAPVDAKTNQSGIDLANFDREVAACTDFYAHANGTWLKNNPVPAAYSTWGTFNELEDRNNDRLLAIAREAAAQTDAAKGSPEWLVGRFFTAAIDEDRVEELGLEPIAGELEAIAAIEGPAELLALVQRYHREGLSMLFGLGVRQDLKDNSRVIAYATQGGLGLPNRDFYLREDDASKAQLDEYRAHIARMLVLAGAEAGQAAQDAAAIVALETRLARTHLPREEMRDPNRSYNIQGVAAASEQTPSLDWRAYFDALGLSQVEEFSFSHPTFFAELDKALNEESAETWRAYARWHLLRTAAPYLPKAILEESFAFYGTTLRGQKEQRPRPVRAVEQMNGMLGEPLGQLFVARHFPPAAKDRMMEMIGNLKLALRDRLKQLEWMGEATKEQALEKWASFTPKIGYPDKWQDYSSVELDPGRFLANVRALGAFDRAQDFAKIGKPIDKSEWGMPPQQVNAYYNPLWNEIVFPAGILQPPFFDMEADDALNYGAIGAVIGHELLHGFDDSGSRFDAEGRLRMWWTEEDRKEFDQRAQRLVDQAAEFVAIRDLRLNGRVSLGENIADLGGLTMAHQALRMALDGKEVEPIDGYTAEQRFFLGWAQVWRRNWTDEALVLQVNTGPHAPGKFRVNGPLANMPEFHQAFHCQPGDPMLRDQDVRVTIW